MPYMPMMPMNFNLPPMMSADGKPDMSGMFPQPMMYDQNQYIYH